ncbi:MAG TPA: endospore germination permease [Capillibacterium sp.]
MEQGKISAGELALLVMSFTIGSWVVLPTGIQAWQNLWLIIFLGLGEGLLLIYFDLALFRRFPGKTLFEIHELVYGPFVGKLFSLCFLWFFLQMGGGTLGIFVTLLKTTVFTATPDLALLIPWVLILVYGCRQGIEVIARSNQLLIMGTVGLVLISILLVLNIFNPENLLPFFNLSFAEMLWISIGIAAFPFGQNILFLMILPRVNRWQKVTGAVCKGMIGAGLVLSTIQFLAVGVVGKAGQILVFPTFEFYRLINIGRVLTRLELIPLLNFLTMGFVKVILCLYALAVGTAHLFNLRTYRPLVIPLGLFLLLVAGRIYPDISEHIRYIQKVQTFLVLFFALLLPLVTLGVAFLRRLPRKGMTP